MSVATGTVVALVLLLEMFFLGEPVSADTANTFTDAGAPLPPSPVHVPRTPKFYVLDGWDAHTEPTAQLNAGSNMAVEIAVTELCRSQGLRFDPVSVAKADLSPLEWPRVFAGEDPDARRQRTEVEALMALNGLAFRPIVILEPNEAADSARMILLAGMPVLSNTPDAYIFFGFDTREPDHWWWVRHNGESEILLESERVRQLVHWTDDPTANLLWAVTGPSEDAIAPVDSKTADFALLRAVSRSVAGDAAHGLAPYPLSLRAMGDSLENADSLPVLAIPISATDPIGIRRVIRAREHVTAALERQVPLTLDTLLSAPLRLAQYYYHSAIASLLELETTLYESGGDLSPIDALRRNWADPTRRRRAVLMLQEDLRRERDALAEVNRALTAYDLARSKP